MNAASPEARKRTRDGLIYGVIAYGSWGVIPIYFKALQSVPAIDIVAHRVVWSVLVVLALATIARVWPAIRAALAHRRTLMMLLLSAVLIGANWLLYVWAINHGHVLASSIGYYLNPLANIVLGRLVLKEQLSKLQWLAVAIAAIGIAVLAAGALDTLWISLTLCMTFATYGLVRKLVAVEALPGLAIETFILLPVAIGWLLAGGAEGRAFPGPADHVTALLIASGLISTIPLLCFTAAARRLAYSSVGMLQFIAPTLQFLLAVALYREPFTLSHAFGALLCWRCGPAAGLVRRGLRRLSRHGLARGR